MAEQKTPLTPMRAFDLVLLTGAAGILDAICYMRVHVFAANMTGNIVLLGLELAENPHSLGGWSLAAILAFIFGSLLAGVILLKWRPSNTPLAEVKLGLSVELPFLLAFTAASWLAGGRQSTWLTTGIVVAGTCAMAVQSMAVRRLKIAGIVTTFVTGTLTTAIADWLSGEKQARTPVNQPMLLASMLIVYVAAAAAAAKFQSTRLPPFLPFLCVAAVRVRWPADR